MADPNDHLKETFITLMVSRGISSEEAAQKALEAMDSNAVALLIDAMREGMGGLSKDLGGGDGFIAGLQNIVESRRIDTETTLPENPLTLTPEEKAEAIKDYEEKISESDSKLVNGLRSILKNKRVERINDLEVWRVELSDPDFPLTLADLDDDQTKRDDELLDKNQKQIDESREASIKQAKKHKNHP